MVVSLDSYNEAYTRLLINEHHNLRMIYLETLEADSSDAHIIKEATGEIISINEGVFDSIFRLIARIINAIADTIEKFFNKIDELIRNDTKWIDDNQKMILSDTDILNNCALSIQNYHPNYIKNVTEGTPQNADLKIESSQDKFKDVLQKIMQGIKDDIILNIQSEGDMFNFYYPDYVRKGAYNKDKGESLSKQLEKYFAGNPETVPVKQILADTKNRKTMYDFCSVGFNKCKNDINNMKDIIKAKAKDCRDSINQIKDASPSEKEINDTNQKPTENGQPNPKPASEAVLSFEDTMNIYFTEVDQVSREKMLNTTTATNNASNNGTAKVVGSENMDAQNNNFPTKSKEFWQKYEKIINCEFKMNASIISAMMNTYKKMYSEFMMQLRWFIDYMKKHKPDTSDGGNAKVTAQAAADLDNALKS